MPHHGIKESPPELRCNLEVNARNPWNVCDMRSPVERRPLSSRGEQSKMDAPEIELDHGQKQYRLLNAQGVIYVTTQKGTLGGYRKLRIYGRLDCASARVR